MLYRRNILFSLSLVYNNSKTKNCSMCFLTALKNKKSLIIFLLFLTSFAFPQKPVLMLPSAHDVECFDVSPNQKYLLTAGEDIKLWDVESSRELANFYLPFNAIPSYYTDEFGFEHMQGYIVLCVNSLKFISDSTFLAFLNNGYIIGWNINTGNIISKTDIKDYSDILKKEGNDIDGFIAGNKIYFQGKSTNNINYTGIFDIGQKKIISDPDTSIDLNQTKLPDDNTFLIEYSTNPNCLIKYDTSLRKLAQSGIFLSPVLSFDLSNDKHYVVTMHEDNTIRIWDTGSLKNIFDMSFPVKQFDSIRKWNGDQQYYDFIKRYETNVFFIDNRLFIGLSREVSLSGYSNVWQKLYTYEIVGDSLHPLKGIDFDVISNSLNKILPGKEKMMVLCDISGFYLMDAISGKLKKHFSTYINYIDNLSYSEKDKTLYTIEPVTMDSAYCYSWDVMDPVKLKHISEPVSEVFDLGSFWVNNMNSKIISYTTQNNDTLSDNVVNILDVKSGKILMTCSIDYNNHNKIYWHLSGDENYILASGLYDDINRYKYKLWDLRTQQLLLDTATYRAICIVPEKKYYFSADSKNIFTYSLFTDSVINKISNNYKIALINYHSKEGWLVQVSNDSIILLDEQLSEICKFYDPKASGGVRLYYMAFSPDKDKVFLYGSNRKGVDIYNCSTHSFSRLEDTVSVSTLIFSSDQKYIITVDRFQRIKFWTGNTFEELCSLYSLDSVNWAVTTPNGLFDASPGAMEKMYFVQGLEIIEFKQLKDIYYEPGLWKKVMEGEKLREVKTLDITLPLYPLISKASINSDGMLNIELTNQGGGIGPVSIRINGKEVSADARGEDIDPDAESAILKFNVSKSPLLLPGDSNEVEIYAYNKDGFLVSRGVKVTYIGGEKKTVIPHIYIVACGVSDYTGESIDLKFAAKDAENIASAMELSANRLFGKDNTTVYHYTTDQESEQLQPTKANITDAFNEISKIAISSDIFVLYLSGHGINWGGTDGDFFYLTKDAYTASPDAYNIESVRKSVSISSNEITELLKTIPALKQVIIIDACASGKLIDEVNLLNQKDIPSSTIRALDRLSNRTGTHIISGCASDAESYEASRFGQGLLTYALLEGMKGSALRENKYVDVVKLFQNAADRVPQLAEGIGGIQQPKIFSVSESFDIGELLDDDKSKIALASEKTMFIKCSFQEEDSFDDILGLAKDVDEAMLSASQTENENSFIFIESDDYADACRIRGRYSLKGNEIEVKINIFKNDEIINSFTVNGTKSGIQKIIEEIVSNAKEITKN
jgi:hypothetical protein